MALCRSNRAPLFNGNGLANTSLIQSDPLSDLSALSALARFTEFDESVPLI